MSPSVIEPTPNQNPDPNLTTQPTPLATPDPVSMPAGISAPLPSKDAVAPTSIATPTPEFTPTADSTPSNPVISPNPINSVTPVAATEQTAPEQNSMSNEPALTQPVSGGAVIGDIAPMPDQPGPSPFSSPGGGSFKAKKSKKKIFLFAGMAVLVLALLAGGYVYAFYLPNRPQTVFKTGLNRSGKALNTVVVKATDKQKLETMKKSEVTLKVDGAYDKNTFNGSMDVKSNGLHVDGNAKVQLKLDGEAEKNIATNFRSIPVNGKQFPDIYFQITGYKDLGLDQFYPGINKYDGKWVSVLSDYLASLSDQTSAKETTKPTLSADDYSELARAASDVTTQYVFSADPAKAVFENKTYYGKEKVDGITAYHYEVTINKQHAKDYCKAMVNKLFETNAYKKLPGVDSSTTESDKKSALDDCDAQSTSVDKNAKFEMWVDSKYKLIHKVRITETDQKDTYTDIGQNYKGGDDIEMFVNTHDGEAKADAKFTVSTNLQTNQTKLTVEATGSGDTKWHVNVALEAKPYDGEISNEKPTGAVPFTQLLKDLGIPLPETTTNTTTTTSNTTQI